MNPDQFGDPRVSDEGRALLERLARLGSLHGNEVPKAALYLDDLIDTGQLPIFGNGEGTLVPLSEAAAKFGSRGNARESIHNLHAMGALLIDTDDEHNLAFIRMVAKRPKEPGKPWRFQGDPDAVTAMTCIPTRIWEELLVEVAGAVAHLRMCRSQLEQPDPESYGRHEGVSGTEHATDPSGDAHALQCVARTRKGSRCLNPVEFEQLLGFHEFQLGYVQTYGSLSAGETVDTDRWLAQHCTLHDTPDITDCETPELRRFDIVRDAAHVRAHRVDVAYDGEPADRADEAGTTGAPGQITGSIAAVFEAAARLRPWPGYINGHQYDEWYIEATPSLLNALAHLACTSHNRELASWLEQLTKPLCMEPLDPVLSYKTLPKTWCFRPVQTWDLPCELHRPERAADLGRCTYAGSKDSRICRTAPLEGGERCKDHAECCRAVKKDGEVCNRRSCCVPQHRQASSLEGMAELAAT